MEDDRLRPSRVVAVHPPVVAEGGGARRWQLSWGFAEWLTGRLGQLPGVWSAVAGRAAGEGEDPPPRWAPIEAQTAEMVVGRTYPEGLEPTHSVVGELVWRLDGEMRVVLQVVDHATVEEVLTVTVQGPPEESLGRLFEAVGSVARAITGRAVAAGAAGTAITRVPAAFEMLLLGLTHTSAWAAGEVGPEAGLHYLERALRLDPALTEAGDRLQMAVALCLKQGGAAARLARRRLDEAVALAPGQTGLRGLRALAMAGAEPTPEALAALEDYLAADPAGRWAREAYDLLATARLKANDVAGARAVLERCLVHFPEDPALLETLGVMLAGLGETAQAQLYLRRCLTEDADRPEALAALGRLLGKRGKWLLAAPLLERALSLRPDDVKFKLEVFRARVENGRLDAADELATAWVEEEPGDARALLSLARVRRLRGDTAAARWCLDRAAPLLTDPGLVEWHARERLWADSPDTARLFERLEEDDGHGVVRPREVALAEARLLELAASRLGTAPSMLWSAAARRFDSAGALVPALVMARRAVEANPADPRLQLQLGDLLVRAGAAEEALAVASRLAHDFPTQLFPLAVQARALALLARHDEAVAVVRRMQSIGPGDPGLERFRIELEELARRTAPPTTATSNAKSPRPEGWRRRLSQWISRLLGR
jgi:tetratricopeptide (TPR) repeat protein